MTLDSWKKRIWEELDTLPLEEQFVVSAEWIGYASNTLLADLAQRRREVVIRLLEQPHLTNADVAELLGLRRSTVVRLVEEGRAVIKRRQRAEHAALRPDGDGTADAALESEEASGLLTPHPSL